MFEDIHMRPLPERVAFLEGVMEAREAMRGWAPTPWNPERPLEERIRDLEERVEAWSQRRQSPPED